MKMTADDKTCCERCHEWKDPYRHQKKWLAHAYATDAEFRDRKKQYNARLLKERYNSDEDFKARIKAQNLKTYKERKNDPDFAEVIKDRNHKAYQKLAALRYVKKLFDPSD